MLMGDRIKECRKAAGLTQEELGEKLGVKKSAVAKWENGRVQNLKRSVIQDMAGVLNVAPSYLMGFDNPDELDDLEKNLMDAYRELPENKKIAVYEFLKSLIE